MRRLRSILIGISAAILSAAAAHAGPPIAASNVTAACATGGVKLTVMLTSLAYGSYGQTLYYHIDPGSTGVQATGTNPMVFTVPTLSPGSHLLWISNQATGQLGLSGEIWSINYPFAAPNCKKGMTWSFISTNTPTGTIRVGCATGCDAHHGDTPCNTPLPLLCIKKTGAGFPLPTPAGVNNTDQYYKWSGGIVGTTAPMVPPTTLAAANTACKNVFDPDWQVAEFHDGWGWHFQAYGGVGNPTQRFWVHVNDQPAVCW
jgi:hypothetical protein